MVYRAVLNTAGESYAGSNPVTRTNLLKGNAMPNFKVELLNRVMVSTDMTNKAAILLNCGLKTSSYKGLDSLIR